MRKHYDENVSAAEEAAEEVVAAEAADEDDEGEDEKPTAEERIYLARMDAGLVTLSKVRGGARTSCHVDIAEGGSSHGGSRTPQGDPACPVRPTADRPAPRLHRDRTRQAA